MKRTHRPRSRGMTLIEVMVVVVILGLIAGAVAIQVFHQHVRAQILTSRMGAKTLRSAASLWRSDNPGETCPTPELLRQDKLIDPGSKLSDAWNTPYKIVCRDDETVAISLGPDRKESDDDLVEPNPIALQR